MRSSISLTRKRSILPKLQAKSSDDLVCAEREGGSLNSIKGKLEQTLMSLKEPLIRRREEELHLRKSAGRLRLAQDDPGFGWRTRESKEGG